ncbi:hypothetical protein J5N97_029816 [Dioscorea zingiberensis]|uniref:SBP-type domain-containing protein n=1 Tax=Dioscorea zingiberensis TaxID=325984 RepID=A0A9D5BWJ9_9LILI|nr:hypothetical protein J5N97_029816 [Dioscorea zingiberensis]
MFLEYEWTNPAAAAAAAAAMLLFGEDNEGVCHDRQVYDHHFGHGLTGDFFSQTTTTSPPVFPATGLFPMPSASSPYGLPLPPAPARIGLNLGVRTYFSSEEGMVVGRVSRRRPRTARCQAQGCGADLTHAKHYHRRHKVCEYHSKASIVITAGLSQRFCQQCSRFHVLSEFDQGKRSCRKRLADHNRRRRKSHDLIASPTMNNNSGKDHDNNYAGERTPVAADDKVLFTTSNSNTDDHDQTSLALPEQQAINVNVGEMVLGLGCYPNEAGGVVVLPASARLSSSPSRFSAEFGDGHFPSWGVDGEDGSSIRADLFIGK